MQRKLRESTEETLLGSHRTLVLPTRVSGHSEEVLQDHTVPEEKLYTDYDSFNNSSPSGGK